MADFIDALASPEMLLTVLLVFGFAPGFVLRLLVKVYPRGNPRRAELVAELYLLNHVQRVLFVADQLGTVALEGIPLRFAEIRANLAARTRDAVADGPGDRPQRSRVLPVMAGAAAVLALVATSTGLAARDAQPGDTLWALTKALYPEHARSVEAAASVRNDLTVGQLALAEGDLAEARTVLLSAEANLSGIASEDGRADVSERHNALAAVLRG